MLHPSHADVASLPQYAHQVYPHVLLRALGGCIVDPLHPFQGHPFQTLVVEGVIRLSSRQKLKSSVGTTRRDATFDCV